MLPDRRRRLLAAGGPLLAAVLLLGAAPADAGVPGAGASPAPVHLGSPAARALPIALALTPATPPPVDPAASSEVLRAQIDALAAQVDELDVTAELALEDLTQVSAELDALSAQEVQAQVSLDDASRELRADRAAAARRVRALYRTGGTVELAWTAFASTGSGAAGAASGFADAASGFQTAQMVLDSDAATVDRARERVDVAVTSSAQVQELRQLRAELETEAELRHRDAEAALSARQALLTSSGEALAGAVERERQQAERVALRKALAAAARAAAVRAAPLQADTYASSDRLSLPVAGARITSQYGYRIHPILGYRKLHAGTDFAAPCGTPITAAADGTVVTAGWGGGFGNLVVVAHGNVGGSSLDTAYAHQSRLAVSAGQQVSRGQVIGYVGSTGSSTGCHLHLETRVADTPVNPMRYL